jgi:hypothetical protein
LHTLVVVRQEGQKGANYNFLDGIAQTFCAIKELELAFCLDFLLLFHQGKRKQKKYITILLISYYQILLNKAAALQPPKPEAVLMNDENEDS